jgi:hypothetical protein
MEENKKLLPTAAGVLGALPWRDRLRIKARALWGLCPSSLRGAVVWGALSPMIWMALALLTRLDPVGHYPLRWGGMYSAALLWMPGIVLASTFLPAARGIVALRQGGLWPEYSAALKGIDVQSGDRRDENFAHWALFSWMWVLSVFFSWLEERGLREAGATLGHSVAWHVLNVARLEICMLIFITLFAGWLSKSGVFKKVEEGGPPTTGDAMAGVAAKADWSQLGSAVKSGGRGLAQWWRALLAEEAGRWKAAQEGSAGKWGAWKAWFADSGYALRASVMSLCATLAWWLAGLGFERLFDAKWQTLTIGAMSAWKFFAIAAMCAILMKLVSRRSAHVVGSALWFGPSGPTAVAWARMVVAALVVDRISVLRMTLTGFCSDPHIAGGGILLVAICWVGLVWMGEAMGWAGAFFEEWSARARKEGGLGIGSYAKVAGLAFADSWRAAGAAKAQLGRAVDEKALQNEAGLAQILRKELEEAVPQATKRGRGSNRL